MAEETWRSVTVVENKRGEPHVLQQKVKVHTAGVTGESSGSTRPLNKHRLVPMKELVEL